MRKLRHREIKWFAHLRWMVMRWNLDPGSVAAEAPC